MTHGYTHIGKEALAKAAKTLPQISRFAVSKRGFEKGSVL